jgi:Tfp pilus assembly pilus retraction ATPase PilT
MGVVAQLLLPVTDEASLIAAAEVMVPNDTIRSAIRADRLEQLHTLLVSANDCVSLDATLRNLLMRGTVSMDDALRVAHSPDALRL